MIAVSDLRGKVWLTAPLRADQGSLALNTENLYPGIYFVPVRHRPGGHVQAGGAALMCVFHPLLPPSRQRGARGGENVHCPSLKGPRPGPGIGDDFGGSTLPARASLRASDAGIISGSKKQSPRQPCKGCRGDCF